MAFYLLRQNVLKQLVVRRFASTHSGSSNGVFQSRAHVLEMALLVFWAEAHLKTDIRGHTKTQE
jgi:hypothetical protein